MAGSSTRNSRPRWPWILAGAFGLLIALYFVLSSGPFLRKVALPIAGKKLNSEIETADISLSPLSSLTLRGVKITPNGAETLATISEVRIRYGLFAILGGNLKVDEVVLDSPAITITKRGSAPSNLDALLSGLPTSSSGSQSEPGAAPKIDVRNVAIKNGSLRMTTSPDGNKSDVIEVGNLNLSLDSLSNGGSGKLLVSCVASIAKAAGDQLRAELKGGIDIGLTPKLAPQAIKGELTLSVGQGTGAFKQVAALASILTVDVSTNQIRQAQLAFKRGNDSLGKVSLSGPYDLDKGDARLNYEISGIGKEVMVLVGSIVGIDFGNASLAATGRLDWKKTPAFFAIRGRIDLARLSLGTTNGATPPMDIGLDYQGELHPADGTVLVERLNLTAVQSSRKIVDGSLDRPMNVAWRGKPPGFAEATYTLVVTNFDLAPWRVVAGPSLPGGRVNVLLKVTSAVDGGTIKALLVTDIDQLSVAIGGAKFEQGTVHAAAAATWDHFTALKVERFNSSLQVGGAQLATLNGVANLHTGSHEIGGQLDGEISLPDALRVVSADSVKLSSGKVNFTFQASDKPEATDIAANISVTRLTGQIGSMNPQNYQVRIDANAKIFRQIVNIGKFTVTPQTGFEQGGYFDFTGSYSLSDKSGKFNFKAAGLNQSALTPLLASAIAPNQLLSAAFDLDAMATVDPKLGLTTSGKAKLGNFRVKDPEGRLPSTPLTLGVDFDLTQLASLTDLRTIRLNLGETPLAKNLLSVSGKVDLGTNNPSPSTVNIASDGLDLGPLYHIFAGATSGTNPPPSKPARPTDSASEPPPIKLPVQKLDLNLDISRVLLDSVAISNWTARAKVDGGKVSLDPVSLSINGAPVTLRAVTDVSVPGYKYEVSASGDQIPLAPFVDTFSPKAKGNMGGTLVAKLDLKGAGTSGASLQKNLSGQFQFAATNLNLRLDKVQNRFLKGIINVVVGLPDAIRNPAGALGKVAQLAGLAPASKSDGWVDELQGSPLQYLIVRGTAGGGRIDIADARAGSSVLRVGAPGSISIAPILTNSPLNFPIEIALKDSLAKKIGLSQTGADFVSLPAGTLTVKGTLGVPKPEPDYLKIAMLLGKSTLGVAGNSAAAVGDLVGKITGAGSSTNSAVETLGGAVKSLGNLLGGGSSTNANSKTNTAKPSISPLDLLNGLGKPKK